MASHAQETDKDRKNNVLVTGRLQKIPSNPCKDITRPTLAAGAVLWRGDRSRPEEIEVAVIHRPRYDDWSLAKGKLDPGESLPVTAAREIEEETGYEVRLDKLIGKVSYPVHKRTKVVYYWLAEVIGGEFTANDEVDTLRWLPIDDAASLLSYQLDVDVLRKAEKRLRLSPDTRVILLRHAKAYQRKNWQGDDSIRPLDKKGRRQAEMLVPLLSAFCPEQLYSAEPDRCQDTIAPLADELGMDVTVNELFGDNAWLSQMTNCHSAISELSRSGTISVVCSQGIWIPDVVAWAAARGQLPIDEIKAKKGSMWMLDFRDGQLVGADYLASALPVK